MRRLRCALALLMFCVPLGYAAAPDDGDGTVRFADSLMLQQRFREAELEYERFAVMRTSSPDLSIVLQKMFSAAMATEDYAFTLKLARAWENRSEGQSACLASFYESQALYHLGNFPAVLKQKAQRGCVSDLADQDIYLRGLSLMRLRQWPEAGREFGHIAESATLGPQARLAAQKASAGPLLPRKSSGLAAGLNAVLPGAGYAYANRPQTAAACAVVNGLFIWGTVASVHAKQPGLAALLSLFSFAWYWGGVSGAAQAAQKESEGRLSAFVEPVELTH